MKPRYALLALALLAMPGIAMTETDSAYPEGMSIRLKPTGKRSNRTVFFDRETQSALRRWIAVRQSASRALFTTSTGERLGGFGLTVLVEKAAGHVAIPQICMFSCSQIRVIGINTYLW